MEHSHFNNFFNWTITYRWDSDFPLPYARIYPAGVNVIKLFSFITDDEA
jgi:hypothetical protein